MSRLHCFKSVQQDPSEVLSGYAKLLDAVGVNIKRLIVPTKRFGYVHEVVPQESQTSDIHCGYK
jgi:hypothetical protein